MFRQGERGRSNFWAAVLTAIVMATVASPAIAAPGYELATGTSSFPVDAEVPRGVAVDQANQLVYVTELIGDQLGGDPGKVEQFSVAGVPTANSPFVTGGSDFFTGVAVNPVTSGVYAYQVQLSTPFGTMGTAQMNVFSSSGALTTSFAPAKSRAPQLATDSAGRVYLPNDSTDSVQVFNSSGTLLDSIPCAGCPGGGFTEPTSVALDSAANLYVVDLPAGGRVIKFTPSAGSYVYNSVLQSGRGAAAVGVDPVSNDVFVGVTSGGYHIVAYDSSGVQIDDFGEGVFGTPPLGALTAGQIAVNATTRKVYIADSGADKVWIFDRVASIPAPTAITDAASSVGQLEANLNATVNPRGHGLTQCEFEYTDHADFLANGLANAELIPCSFTFGGSVPVQIPAHVEGLDPETEYHYRVVTASNGGTSEGTIRTFTTLPPLPPVVTTGSASLVKQTTATIAGSVNPRGGVISDCHFEYTDEAGFQEDGFDGAISVSCAPKKPSGTTSTPVTAKLTGLVPETGYRFRLLATNNSGGAEGSDASFTSLAETCETNPALCPPDETPDPVTPPVSSPAQAPVVTPPAATPPPKRLTCRKGFKKKKVRGKLRCVKIKRKHR
jgi:hypothetical protein